MKEGRFDIWRKCWEDYLLGSQVHPDGEYEQQIIASVDRMASLDLDYAGYGDDSECTVATPVFGLRARALAYRTAGSRHYRDPAVARQVLAGLEDFYRTSYNADLGPEKTENWWLFEIGAPLRILDILILLYEELPDREALIRRYTDVILHFRDAYKASARGREETGANLMWKCHILLLTGILRREETWIEWANEKIPTTLRYSRPMQVPGVGNVYDDGFYRDGSFIQHYMFAYTGGYGKHFLSILSGLIFAFRGQDCLRIPAEEQEFLFRMVKEAYLPLLYQGHMMDVCRGREPSRYWCEDKDCGTIILRALLFLGAALPENEARELAAILKEQLALPETRARLFRDFHPSAEYYATPSLAERVRALEESSVEAALPLEGHYNFGVMCKPVHRTDRYAFAVSMYSRNIACYERHLKESTVFWHMSDGATYLYTGSGETYSGDYYATADMQRLAGTTIERSPKRAEDPYYSWSLPEARNVYAFAGGATLGKAGIAGMQYRGQGNGKERSLEVRKSWFMFRREIVCLGSGISSSTGNPVETIISNDRLAEQGGAFRVVTGKGLLSLEEGRETVIETDGIYVSQVRADGSISENGKYGCIFPGGARIHLLLEHRRGTWNQVTLNPAHVSENEHLAVWISHGRCPEEASYAYALLPAAGEEEWRQVLREPAFEILENSLGAHAVRSLSEKLLGINFWQETPSAAAGIECSTQAGVLVLDTDGHRTVAVADPTKQDRQISIRFLDDPGDALRVDTTGTEGGTVVTEM